MTTIYCRITINGIREDIGSTGIKVPYGDFDVQKGRVCSSNPNFAAFNLRLQNDFEVPINALFAEAILLKQPTTANAIKYKFLNQDNRNIALVDAYKKFLIDFEKKTKTPPKANSSAKPRRSVSTLKPLKVCQNKLITYLIEEKQLKITIEELSEAWYESFEDWLYTMHADSTVKKHLRTLTQITRWAKKKKLCSTNPLEDISVESELETDPYFLTPEQLNFWTQHKFSTNILQECADLFAVYCRTGFHYLDLQQVIRDPDSFIKKGIDNKMWIYKPREKSEVMAKVPAEAFDEVTTIVERYGGWQNLPLKQNHQLNSWLKVCVVEINLHLPPHIPKIYEGLTVKHGRCTLSDWWLNELGGSQESLLPVLGRKTKKGLGRYAKPDERAVLKALNLRNSS